jgi:hypothetical protein
LISDRSQTPTLSDCRAVFTTFHQAGRQAVDIRVVARDRGKLRQDAGRVVPAPVEALVDKRLNALP